MSLNIVIMCGGSGTRLWPLSRELLPKQFLKITDKDKSMFQLCCLRVSLLKYNKILVLCNHQHVFIAQKQLNELEIKDYQIVGEPMSKNTAPSIALACQLLEKQSNILVVSSDHVFDDSRFCLAVLEGLPQTQDGIVTFGIKPTSAHIGYGYIKYESYFNESSPEQPNKKFNKLIQFVEKPNLELAQQFLKSDNYLWNSGNFLFFNQKMINEFNEHCPDIIEGVINILDRNKDLQESPLKLDKDLFSSLNPNNLSIDYAIMEKQINGRVVVYQGPWSDIGSFASLHEYKSSQVDGNVFEGLVYDEDCSNCLIRGIDNKIVAGIGLDNIVVIDTEDALLVSNKNECQKVKKIV